jgi:hypothetical protein
LDLHLLECKKKGTFFWTYTFQAVELFYDRKNLIGKGSYRVSFGGQVGIYFPTLERATRGVKLGLPDFWPLVKNYCHFFLGAISHREIIIKFLSGNKIICASNHLEAIFLQGKMGPHNFTQRNFMNFYTPKAHGKSGIEKKIRKIL